MLHQKVVQRAILTNNGTFVILQRRDVLNVIHLTKLRLKHVSRYLLYVLY